MSRRRRSARKDAVRGRVARAKLLRRRARAARGARLASAVSACALAGTGVMVAGPAVAGSAATATPRAAEADCATTPGPSSDPRSFAAIGGTVFFAASDGVRGRELWKSDGTTAGTVLVKNIRPDTFGRPGSRPENLTVVGSTLYFTADDGTRGRELWKSDGTRAGTVMVKDIFAGGGSSNPEELTAAGSRLFFTARDGSHGTELWRSDGSRRGTVLVRDILPRGVDYGTPRDLTAVDGKVFFSASDNRHGVELWRSNGSRAGTFMVKDIHPSALGPDAESSDPESFASLGRKILFSAEDGTRGAELWKSDGTRRGTELVKNINPGGEGSSPGDLTRLGGRLYFSAYDDVRGNGLWATDGTRAGTVLVKDIQLTDEGYHYMGSSPTHLTRVGKRLFFAALESVSEEEISTSLWVSNGSGAGTTQLEQLDIETENLHVFPMIPFTAIADRLFFSASDGVHGEELWMSDGSVDGTVMVEDINPCQEESYGYGYGYEAPTAARSDGRLFFAASDITHGQEAWVSDGTPEGTFMLKDINPARSP